MAEQKVGIVTECVCDLPKRMLEQYDIRIVYFVVRTAYGTFYDSAEITARNVFDYMEEGSQVPISMEPDPEIYRQIYGDALKKYDELIHIAISSKTSNSCTAAGAAVASMKEAGRRVHIFDSGHLSAGQGHLVLLAAELAAAGETADRILEALNALRDKVSTSFVVNNVDYLYYNGRLSEKVKKICDRFSLHPVLAMKDGELALDSILIGSYEKICRKYIRKLLRRSGRIDTKRIFLTHAGCSVKVLEQFKAEIEQYCTPEKLIVTDASATVSCNCGPGAFGILFCQK